MKYIAVGLLLMSALAMAESDGVLSVTQKDGALIVSSFTAMQPRATHAPFALGLRYRGPEPALG